VETELVGEAGIEPTTPGLEDVLFRYGFDLPHIPVNTLCSVFTRSSERRQPMGTTPVYSSVSFRVGTKVGTAEG
jgi:hypothetical protein